MSYSERASSGRCIGCNHVVVTAWLCDACAMGGREYAARFLFDKPSATATAVSKGMRRRMGRDAEHEQLMTIIGMNDSGVSTVGDHQGARGENNNSSGDMTRRNRKLMRSA